MNKTELAGLVAARTGMTKKDAEPLVNAVFDTIVEALAKGEKVQLSGFGIFEVKDREPRVGRNPHTGEPVQIPAFKAASFKPGKGLKDAVSK